MPNSLRSVLWLLFNVHYTLSSSHCGALFQILQQSHPQLAELWGALKKFSAPFATFSRRRSPSWKTDERPGIESEIDTAHHSTIQNWSAEKRQTFWIPAKSLPFFGRICPFVVHSWTASILNFKTCWFWSHQRLHSTLHLLGTGHPFALFPFHVNLFLIMAVCRITLNKFKNHHN